MEDLKPWEKIVLEKRKLRDEALKPYLVNDLHARAERTKDVAERSRIEPEAHQSITEIDSVEVLHRELAEGKFTAEDVTLAYIKRLGLYNLLPTI